MPRPFFLFLCLRQVQIDCEYLNRYLLIISQHLSSIFRFSTTMVRKLFCAHIMFSALYQVNTRIPNSENPTIHTLKLSIATTTLTTPSLGTRLIHRSHPLYLVRHSARYVHSILIGCLQLALNSSPPYHCFMSLILGSLVCHHLLRNERF